MSLACQICERDSFHITRPVSESAQSDFLEYELSDAALTLVDFEVPSSLGLATAGKILALSYFLFAG
jgi:hypothetical protein